MRFGLPPTATRVRMHTHPAINKKIDRRTKANINSYINAHEGQITNFK